MQALTFQVGCIDRQIIGRIRQFNLPAVGDGDYDKFCLYAYHDGIVHAGMFPSCRDFRAVRNNGPSS